MTTTKNVPTVVIATGTMNAGGTETLIMEMLRHNTGRVRYVMLIHYNEIVEPGVFDKEIRELGVEMRYIPSVGSVGTKNYIKAFKAFVDGYEAEINIVHSHLNGIGGVISLAAKRAGVKHRICHCHADIHITGQLKSRIINEIKLTAMKAIIESYATDRWACSTAAWRRLFMPWHKQVVINNMIDTRRYLTNEYKRRQIKEKYGLEGKMVVGAVGRVAPIKNYETVLRAIKETDAHFVCFGRFDPSNKYCSSLIALAKQLDITEQVHWMGNSNAVADDIHCIDVFVMPSFTEGFGMAAIEAQAAGLPCLLSSGVPGMVDISIELATFLPPDDVVSWHNAITKFKASDRPSIERLLEKFKEKGYDSPTAVRNIEDKYISMIKK